MPLYALGDAKPLLPADSDFWIAPGAQIIGDVRLARYVGIWFGAVLRGDNEPVTIGEGSNVQEHAMLHTDPGYPAAIGAHVTVGHRAIIHRCTIGDCTLIGMGATILNGAIIGRNSLVGAGALVTEGKEFPDGTLIMGVPAKVVRQLTAEEVERIGASAHNYVANWKRFADELRVLK